MTQSGAMRETFQFRNRLSSRTSTRQRWLHRLCFSTSTIRVSDHSHQGSPRVLVVTIACKTSITQKDRRIGAIFRVKYLQFRKTISTGLAVLLLTRIFETNDAADSGPTHSTLSRV